MALSLNAGSVGTPLRPSKSTSSFLAPTVSLSVISRVPSGVSLPALHSPPSAPLLSPSNSASSFGTFSETWPANAYIDQRDGEILGRNLILKSDNIPDAYSSVDSLSVHLSGAPNFRQIADFPVFGVGQPASHGVQSILNHLRQPTIMWISLREEPVVYLNNRSYVLREVKHPFRNMTDFAGIGAERIEQIEQQLKEDLLREASVHNGNVLVHRELSGARMIPVFESVSESTVQTSRDIFRALQAAAASRPSASVNYLRVPVTAEGMFDFADFDTLTRCIRQSTRGQAKGDITSIIFNCQMGRSRTTLGTVVAALLFQRAGFIGAVGNTAAAVSNLKFTDLPAIQKLLRFLACGKESKANVDAAIEWCGRVTNLATELEHARMDVHTARTDDRRKLLTPRAAACLERYFYLISFSEYLLDTNWQDEANTTFADWMRSRPQIVRIAADFIRGERAFDPPDHLKSLAYASGIDAQTSLALSNRTGTVISESSIIKAPPTFVSRSSSSVSGAPNFRHLGTAPIMCTAQPTITGIRNVLSLLEAVPDARAASRTAQLTDVSLAIAAARSSTPSAGTGKSAVWINLTEEACVFVSDVPCTLRDAVHPFRSLSEFRVVAMPRDRLEELEERLALEACEEIDRCAGQLLVHEEHEHFSLTPIWVRSQKSDVRSEASVYAQLQQEGFRVQYHRIPLVVDAVPDTIALDLIFAALTQSDVLLDSNRPIVFQCYLGGRRSAVGMGIALLVRRNFQRLYGSSVSSDQPNVHVQRTAASTTHADAQSSSSSSSLLSPIDESQLAKLESVTASAARSPSLGPAEPTAQHDRRSGVFELGGAPILDPCSTVCTIGADDRIPPLPSLELDSNVSVSTARVPDESGSAEENTHRSGNYRAIIGLCRIIKQGRQIKEEVDDALLACGGQSYIQDFISAKRTQWETEHDADRQALLLQDMTSSLQSYCMLIIFNAFLHEYFYKADATPLTTTFTEWMRLRPELTTQLENIAKSPEDALRLDSTLSAHDDNAHVFAERRGNVLIGTSILKCDYFPGCQNPALALRVDGAPNVRFMAPTLLLGGTAMPNIVGVQSVLSMLPGVAQQALRSVRWVCLREEPVIYIGNTPYVLRDLDRPYNNFEFTGINTRRVEAIERQLKRDVLDEMRKYGGRLLLHDETAGGSLVGVWTDVAEDAVLTTKEMYLQAMSLFASKQLQQTSAAGLAVGDDAAPTPADALSTMRIVYSRVPITDEQAPTIEVFDWFVRHTESANDGQFLLFNCQMGRGRTTTAIIIAALITLQRPENALSFERVEQLLRASAPSTGGGAGHAPPAPTAAVPAATAPAPSTVLAAAAATTTVRLYSPEQIEQFQLGNFHMIMRLVRLLENGTHCKQQVDRIVEAAAHMQNLRDAIWATKARADRALSAHQREEGNERAKAYLVRYALLICFNAFLLNDVAKGTGKTFADFMRERPALTNCLDDVRVA